MARQIDPGIVHQTFSFSSEADLNVQIAAHRAQHQLVHAQTLAMQARRSLGAGKAMITFRVVEKS